MSNHFCLVFNTATINIRDCRKSGGKSRTIDFLCIYIYIYRLSIGLYTYVPDITLLRAHFRITSYGSYTLYFFDLSSLNLSKQICKFKLYSYFVTNFFTSVQNKMLNLFVPNLSQLVCQISVTQ